MAVRTTMATLITRVRVLINDTDVSNQVFADQTIQDVLDASRMDVTNAPLEPRPTYSGTTIQYLDYYASYGDWEDDLLLKQFLTQVVTPSVSENIVGHWHFTQTTLPPVYITGKTYDIYRASADLLERWAAKWVLAYSMSVDGQSLQRGNVTGALQNLAKTYREQQRPMTMTLTRSDLNNRANNLSLRPSEMDYIGSGDGR